MNEIERTLIDFSLKSHGIVGVKADEVTDLSIYEANGGVSINYRLPSGEERREWAAWSKLERLRVVTQEAVRNLLK